MSESPSNICSFFPGALVLPFRFETIVHRMRGLDNLGEISYMVDDKVCVWEQACKEWLRGEVVEVKEGGSRFRVHLKSGHTRTYKPSQIRPEQFFEDQADRMLTPADSDNRVVTALTTSVPEIARVSQFFISVSAVVKSPYCYVL